MHVPPQTVKMAAPVRLEVTVKPAARVRLASEDDAAKEVRFSSGSVLDPDPIYPTPLAQNVVY